jgi:hypothetical protein
MIAVQLHELGEIHGPAKHVFHAALLKVKAIRRKLKSAFCKMTLQASEKLVRPFASALSYQSRESVWFRVQARRSRIRRSCCGPG